MCKKIYVNVTWEWITYNRYNITQAHLFGGQTNKTGKEPIWNDRTVVPNRIQNTKEFRQFAMIHILTDKLTSLDTVKDGENCNEAAQIPNNTSNNHTWSCINDFLFTITVPTMSYLALALHIYRCDCNSM